jgi:hypothetical protein
MPIVHLSDNLPQGEKASRVFAGLTEKNYGPILQLLLAEKA